MLFIVVCTNNKTGQKSVVANGHRLLPLTQEIKSAEQLIERGLGSTLLFLKDKAEAYVKKAGNMGGEYTVEAVQLG